MVGVRDGIVREPSPQFTVAKHFLDYFERQSANRYGVGHIRLCGSIVFPIGNISEDPEQLPEFRWSIIIGTIAQEPLSCECFPLSLAVTDRNLFFSY